MEDTTLAVRASEVRAGDRVYNNLGYCESAKWVTVLSVEVRLGNPYPGTLNPRHYIVIHTTSFDTWKDPREGVTVKRRKE